MKNSTKARLNECRPAFVYNMYVCGCSFFFVCLNFDQQAIDLTCVFFLLFLVYDKYNILIIYKDPMK